MARLSRWAATLVGRAVASFGSIGHSADFIGLGKKKSACAGITLRLAPTGLSAAARRDSVLAGSNRTQVKMTRFSYARGSSVVNINELNLGLERKEARWR